MGSSILQDLVVVMVLAAAVTIVFYRLRQPVVLGYLLAGLVVGPNTLGLVHDLVTIRDLADLGIIFLMFAVGLEFDLKKLRKVGATAAIAAALEVSVMLAVGYFVGQWMGWDPMQSIFLGAIVSISSTSIIVKILTDMGKLKEDYSELAFGILIIEDILAVVIVALLTAMGTTGTLEFGIVPSTIGSVALFVFIFVSVGLVLVPRLIDVVSKFHAEEVLVITVVGLAFGAALLAVSLSFSIALGAFLMGAIIAESKAVRRVEHKIVPLRDLFTAVFFVAVGMLIDPRILIDHWGAILIVAAVTIVGKVVAVTISTFAVGKDGRTALKTGTALGQIGEFSFIIAGLGLQLNVVSPELPPIAIAVCAITSLASGTLIKFGPVLVDSAAPHMPRWWVRVLDAYTHSVRKVFARSADPLAKHDAKRSRHGARVFIYAAWLFGLLVVSAYASSWLGDEVGQRLSLSSNAERAAAIGFLGLLCLPLFVAFTKATEAYTYAAAKAHDMNPKRLTKRDRLHRQPKFIARVVSFATSGVILYLAVRIAWGVHPLAVPNTWLLLPILGLIVAIGFFGWHKLERVYLGMETTLNELMGTEQQATAAEDRNQRLRERLPFGMDAEEYRVKNFTRTAYASLKSLSLRDKTGATVLAVERLNNVIHNPHADLLLLPNDRIVLVGSLDQLSKAEQYLDQGIDREVPILQGDFRVPGSSPAVGHTLGEVELPPGARIGMVQKKDGQLYAPNDRVRIEPDDHIVLYGPEASLERTREKLRVRPIQDPRPKRGPSG
ncbi:MAG: cation:proton antiporter [Candidatus Thermoplasmatota archaeon]